MPAARDQRVHQLVAVLERRRAARRVDPVGARGGERVGAARRARWPGVSSPTAIPTFACLVGKLVSSIATDARAGGCRSRALADREPRDRGASLGVRHVARHRRAHRRPVRVALLERDDAADDAPVELGNRHLRSRVQRRKTGLRLEPRGPRQRLRKWPGSPARRARPAPSRPIPATALQPPRPRPRRRPRRRPPVASIVTIRASTCPASSQAPVLAIADRDAACNSRPPGVRARRSIGSHSASTNAVFPVRR